MSKYNTSERCIAKFMEQLKKSQQMQSKVASDDFKAGFQHAFDLAQIWFSDQVIELEEETEVQNGL